MFVFFSSFFFFQFAFFCDCLFSFLFFIFARIGLVGWCIRKWWVLKGQEEPDQSISLIRYLSLPFWPGKRLLGIHRSQLTHGVERSFSGSGSPEDPCEPCRCSCCMCLQSALFAALVLFLCWLRVCVYSLCVLACVLITPFPSFLTPRQFCLSIWSVSKILGGWRSKCLIVECVEATVQYLLTCVFLPGLTFIIFKVQWFNGWPLALLLFVLFILFHYPTMSQTQRFVSKSGPATFTFLLIPHLILALMGG